jgi:hypothetical protein
MNFINDILLKIFNCGLNNITSIIFDYAGLYFQNEIIHFETKVTSILQLTNNRIAIGFHDGTICIYDTSNKTKTTYTIIKNSVISTICQINDNIIACGLPDRDCIMIYDFKHNDKYLIKCESGTYIFTCRLGSDITFFNNMLICSSKYSRVMIIHLNNLLNNERIMVNLSEFYIAKDIRIDVSNVIIFNDICLYSKSKLSYYHTIKSFPTDLLNTTNCFSTPNKKIHKSGFLIKLLYLGNNKIAIVEKYMVEHQNFDSNIIIMNMLTMEHEHNILVKGLIVNVVSLKYNRIAVVISNQLFIYNILTGDMLQRIILENGNKIILSETIDCKLLIVDRYSDVRIYE